MKDDYSVSQINVVDLRQKTLVESLYEIEKKPWMWLSINDILSLKSFINGWIVGRNEKSDEQLLEDFDRFVVNEFNEGTSTLGWCTLVIKHCGEHDSLKSFYNLFHKYMEARSEENDCKHPAK